MPFEILQKDVTKLPVDAIVNPTDSRFYGSGGVDRAVHQAAGPGLRQACGEFGPLSQGELRVTSGFGLQCEYVFHTRGPVWAGGRKNEAVLLRGCYLNALLKAGELGLSSIAFPLISSGTFGFPKDRVLAIATAAIRDYLTVTDGELSVYLCIYDRDAYKIGRRGELERFLRTSREEGFLECKSARLSMEEPVCFETLPCEARSCEAPEDLGVWLKQQDDSFAVTLLKLIDRKNMTEVQCYKRANVSKKTFWKINNDPKYKPSKQTVLAFAIALELTLEETEDLLRTVGFSLSHSNTFDMIIEFYIRRGIYDIYEINAALYQFDQICLGC